MKGYTLLFSDSVHFQLQMAGAASRDRTH